MRIKSGVVLWDMEPYLVDVFDLIDDVTRMIAGRDAVITSGREGKHSEGSLHYRGCAVDLRTWGMTPSVQREYVEVLSEVLGDDFDVVLELTHVHVEYDPDE
jgi:hypothetical protein